MKSLCIVRPTSVRFEGAMPKGSPAVMVIVFGHVFLKSVKHTQKSRSVPSSQNHAYIPKYAVRAVTLVTVPPVFRSAGAESSNVAT